MTQQQYDRAVQISERLKELEKVRKEISTKSSERLTYSHKDSDGDWREHPSWLMKYVGDILDRHDLMIRQEIDDEINNLKKEIETL